MAKNEKKKGFKILRAMNDLPLLAPVGVAGAVVRTQVSQPRWRFFYREKKPPTPFFVSRTHARARACVREAITKNRSPLDPTAKWENETGPPQRDREKHTVLNMFMDAVK